jgi:hypothetical protein
MQDTTPGRRTFLTLLGAGALTIVGPGRARAWNVFEGQQTFDRVMKLATEQGWSERPVGERIGAAGLALRDTPYVDGTLERAGDREVCSVDLRGLDCVTFYENALGFARMLRRGGRTPEALLAEVTFTRYRGGRLTDYASRLHYTVDWFADNEAKRVVRLITGELPGTMRFTRRVDFMSTHPGAYRQLQHNPALVEKIARIEADINARAMVYVPKDKVRAAQPLLKTGDIVGITTTIEGLDCAHTGLCYRDNAGVLRLLHASTTRRAVVLDEELATYLAGVSTHTGIMVARPLEV